MYRSQIGLKVKIRQSGSVLEHIVYSQALDMVNGYCTSSEPPDMSVEQVASPEVSNFSLN